MKKQTGILLLLVPTQTQRKISKVGVCQQWSTDCVVACWCCGAVFSEIRFSSLSCPFPLSQPLSQPQYLTDQPISAWCCRARYPPAPSPTHIHTLSNHYAFAFFPFIHLSLFHPSHSLHWLCVSAEVACLASSPPKTHLSSTSPPKIRDLCRWALAKLNSCIDDSANAPIH